MSLIKRVVLDVLKPHHPNALEFASAIADAHAGCRVRLTVLEVDEKTETVTLVVESGDVPYQELVETIQDLGGSVHSIDEVEVINSTATAV